LPFKIIFKILFISVLSGILPSTILLFNLNPILSFSIGAVLFGFIYIFSAYKCIPLVREMIIPFTKILLSRKKIF
jgi:hypothetical protein